MRVLIAEDDLVSRTLLDHVLSHAGYTVESTVNGVEALAAMMRPDAPRLAILDWMMPKMDGPEVLKRLLDANVNPPPYCILLTSKRETEDVIRGLESGASDYVAKPFDKHELLARVAVARRIIETEDRLHIDRARLETIVQNQVRELVRADRMATIGTLAAGVAHEINNPTTFISGNLSVLRQCVDIICDHIPLASVAPQHPQLREAMEQLPLLETAMHTGVDRIQTIVNGLRTYARKDDHLTRRRVRLEDCIDDALVLCTNNLKYNVVVKRKKCTGDPVVMGHKQEIEQVLINLFVNAAHAMKRLSQGVLTIETSIGDQVAQIEVSDTGPGVPAHLLNKIFNPFFTTKSEDQGTGLGLSISKNIIESFGGTITMANIDTGGARFIIRLPFHQPTETTVPTSGESHE